MKDGIHTWIFWGGQAFFSSFNSKSRGVAILIKKDFLINIKQIKRDTEGNFLSILAEIYGKLFLITGVYGPNEDNPIFSEEKIFTLIDEFNPQYCLFGGDFNLVLNQEKDTYNYLHNNNIKARKWYKQKWMNVN